MSTFRPPQVPQQPRIFYTPGQPPGAVPPVSPSQAAAYFRQRQEGPQLQQFNVAAPPGPLVLSRALQVPAAPRRDMTPELEEVAPFFTPAQAAGIVPPVAPDQRAAYFRPLPQVLQITYWETAADTPGVPPPQAPDQRAAYFRQLPPVLQITVNATPGAAPGPQVPPPPLQMPGPGLRSMIVEIEETLPFFTPPPGAAIVPAPALQIPHAARRSMLAELAAARGFFVAPLPVTSSPLSARMFTMRVEPVAFSAGEAHIFGGDAEPRIFRVDDEARVFGARPEQNQSKGKLQ